MNRGGHTKKGTPSGPLRAADFPAGLAREACRGDGGDKAERQEEHGSRAVEQPFKASERHDTHLLELNPRGSGGVCYLNNAKIAAI